MTYTNFKDEPVSNSKFYMIRCIIAMAHADGEVCDEERAYITALNRHLNFSEEQQNIIQGDLETAKDVADLFRHINDPRFRGQVIYFARIMAYKDGVLDPSEQELLDKLHFMATDGIDMDAIKAVAKNATQLKINAQDIEIDKIRPQGGLFGLFDAVMLKAGIDLMKD